MAKTHDASGVGRCEGDNPLERKPALVVSLTEQNREQRFQAGTARRRRPDAAGFGGNIAVNVIGGDGVDFPVAQSPPQPFAVGCFAERRVDFADIAARPADVMRQVVRAGFNMHIGASAPMTERRLQRFG
jgi:hypothetical protein